MAERIHAGMLATAALIAAVTVGSFVTAAQTIIEKSACLSKGNAEAACTCADKSARDGFQKAVTPAVFAAITSGKAEEMSKLAKGDLDTGMKALVDATGEALKACSVKLQ